MSMKRQATRQLNHENWDQEDPEEKEEIGTFKTASQETLEKRVIRTAKRRTQGSSDEAKKSVFSGFGGFNKTQTSSFDFLANLTNGNKNTNNDKTTNDTSVSNSVFASKPAIVSQSGIFSTTTSPAKSATGSSNAELSGNLFSASTNTASSSSIFSSIKADSTVKDSPFKIQPATSTGGANADDSKLLNTNTTGTPASQVTSNIFGVSSVSGTTPIAGKSLFTTTNNTSNLFKTQATGSVAVLNTTAATNPNNAEKTSEMKDNEKKMIYYTKLKGLNESVSEWINKHVEETPLCILTPIFKDYENYLKEMQNEFNSPDKDNSSKMLGDKGKSQSVPPAAINSMVSSSSNNTSSGALVSKTDSPTSKPSIFGNPNNTFTFAVKPSGFSFGVNSSSVTSSTGSGITFGNNNSSSVATTTTTNTGFSFGNKISSTVPTTASTSFTLGNKTSTSISTTASAGFAFGITSSTTSTTTTTTPFSFTPNKTSNATPFSFGIGKPFSFSSNITQNPDNTEATNDAQEEEDAPPKVEFTPIAEENSVFDKRCKIFLKKDGNFVDKGVGTLYIKKIADSDKHQLLVRANTTLGNVLLNLRLSSTIPTQRMGKNNVMLVCIPTPESKPPPTPVLVRVKTAEEADQLLETLNKYKS